MNLKMPRASLPAFFVVGILISWEQSLDIIKTRKNHDIIIATSVVSQKDTNLTYYIQAYTLH